jgi:polysaccharide export outer membrane protein
MINNKALHMGVAAFLATALLALGQEKQGSQSAVAPIKDTLQAPTESVQKPPSAKYSTGPELQVRNPRYRLRYSDVLEIKFPLTPEYNETVTIMPDGFINLLHLTDLHVEGKTQAELTAMLEAGYGKILEEPEIQVRIVDFEKPYFIVGGQVKSPGKYEMRGDTSVGQAVNIAGGFTEAAKHSQILLLRRVSDEWVEVTDLDLDKIFLAKNSSNPDLNEDLHLSPGDMVYVPDSFISKIKKYMPHVSWGIRVGPSQY